MRKVIIGSRKIEKARVVCRFEKGRVPLMSMYRLMFSIAFKQKRPTAMLGL
jgi:hypothetical protein